MKSNITIASNVYHRSNDDIAQDTNYIKAISDPAFLKKIAPQISTSRIKLDSWQEKLIKDGEICYLNREAGNADSTHGLIKVDDKHVLSCRCEYKECKNYEKCMSEAHSVRIEREIDDINNNEIDDNTLNLFNPLGDTSNIFEESEFEDEEKESEEENSNEEDSSEYPENILQGTDFIKIKDANIIITDKVNSHILVNAGPGTGKTHTIIKRLEYIAKNKLVKNFWNVLVLCYTNTAKNEIIKRLEAGIKSGELPQETQRFSIRTFDSLATHLSDSNDEKFSNLDYNGRIARFNELFDGEKFSDYEYVIIDELQDLVYERAKMTLNIVASVKGGWLLCGDKCQAIYDYNGDGKNEIKSIQFYEMLEESFTSDVKKYEIIGNRRQSDELAQQSEIFRDKLLSCEAKEVNKFFNDELAKYKEIEFSSRVFKNCDKNLRTAILCRSNAQAEWLSAKLLKENIPHNLLRNSNDGNYSLNRWIADIFWDFHDKRCKRTDFIDRYCARICDDEIIANKMFDAVRHSIEIVLDKKVDSDLLEMNDFRETLQKENELDKNLINTQTNHLVVTTIHKAKGREFDNVYLLNQKNKISDNTENARVVYVGITRAKKNLKIFTLPFIDFSKSKSNSNSNRCIRKREKYKKTHCAYITVLPNDIEKISFVDGDLSRAISNQKYIAENVKINDEVTLILNDGKYEIFHDCRLIGSITDEAKQDFKRCIDLTDYNKNMPPFISGFFVSNIVAVTPQYSEIRIEPMFKESLIWLGVEITGFGKIDWHYGKNA